MGYKDASSSPNSNPKHICGKETDTPVVEIISDGSSIGVEFVAHVSAEGNNGSAGAPFKIGWTEIQPGDDCPYSYFKCAKSNHCIPRQFVCDRTAHCGVDPSSNTIDASDE